MKKLFLVAALGVAGLVSASEPVKGNEKEVVSQENAQKLERMCVQVLTSCGKRAVACGETTMEIIGNALVADELSCPSQDTVDQGGL